MAQPSVAVFAPSPVLTVTVEPDQDGDEIHLHAGGQGVWIAGMATRLSADVELVATFGGEVGPVIRALLDAAGFRVRAVPTVSANGVYVHDRRDGAREEVARMKPQHLSRHESDDLHSAALISGLNATVTVLAGSMAEPIVSPSRYQNLATDLAANDRTVVADLAGDSLRAAVEGGAHVVKISEETIREGGWDLLTATRPLPTVARDILDAGAQMVVVSRVEDPILVFTRADCYEIDSPRFQAAESRGTGDAMTGGIAVGLASGAGPVEATVLGVAAGAMNAVRHGLGTGRPEDIEALTRLVTVRAVSCEPSERSEPRVLS